MKRLYIAVLAVMAFTGMGQMPIFSRYYVADIPGMAWAGDFYVTHTIHYLGAIVLFALFSYVTVYYLFRGRKTQRLSLPGVVRVVLLAGLVVTGIVRVMKNLPDVSFSPGVTMLIDIAHLGFMMVFLFTALGFLISRKGWVRQLNSVARG